MKTHVLTVIGITVALLSAWGADPYPSASTSPSATASVGPSPSGSPVESCNRSSWNPELYTFYGEQAKVAEKVSNLPAKLPERRVFLQITQGDKSGEVRLFERQKDGTFNVTEWQAKSTSQLVCDIDKAIMANKGVNCVGEQIKAAIKRALKEGHTSQSVAPPETPAAAFGHSINQAKGEFIKSTIILAC